MPPSETPKALPKPVYDHRPSLSRDMTFQRFVTRDCNRFAVSSSLAVAKNPIGHYNPLYLCSQDGLGKTHLLNAIGHLALEKNPSLQVSYFSADSYTSAVTGAMRLRQFDEMREKHEYLDLLLFDDIQLLNNRWKVQEAFLHLFNTLHGEKKQIVVTGNCLPNHLNQISPHLKSRLGWGLIAEINPPPLNTKVDIIKNRFSEDGVNIPDDVIFFLANSSYDIKKMIKNIVKIESYASLGHGSINISTVRSLIRGSSKKGLDVEDIKNLIAGYFKITPSELISDKKGRAYSYPRQLAMYMARRYTHLSYKEIGNAFGPKDHSTVIYAVKKVESLKGKNTQLQKDIENIENILK
jgi:chromosomal replication initiator protein